MGGGGAVEAEEGEAPAGGRMLGGGSNEGAGLVSVEQPPAADFGWGGIPPKQRACMDDQIDHRGHRHGRARTGNGVVRAVATAVLIVVVVDEAGLPSGVLAPKARPGIPGDEASRARASRARASRARASRARASRASRGGADCR